jgi:outer membrane autotransporter protein
LLRYREMLPDHQGGVFDVLSQGSRALAPTQAATPWAQLGHVSLWVQQAIWDEHQDANLTPGNGGSGWGLTGGGDVAIGGNSRVGLSIGYIHGSVRDSGDNEVNANQFGGGIHWLSDFGNFHVAAYGNAGYVTLHGKRAFSGTTETAAAVLSNTAKWNGINMAAGAKASYEAKMGAFYLRPSGELTYNRLTEDGYTEAGGGTAFDLTVAKRKSSELAATGLLAAGIHLGNQTDPEAATFRFELEGGRRQILNSNLDGTTAHFTGGSDFTLLPEDRKSGWIGGANASVGSSSFRFIASGQYETRSNGQRVLSGRFGFRGSF